MKFSATLWSILLFLLFNFRAFGNVIIQNNTDAFLENTNSFENPKSSVFSVENQSSQEVTPENFPSQENVEKTPIEVVFKEPQAPIAVMGDRPEPMLFLTPDRVIANSNVLNDAIFTDILQLTQYLYFSTKRYAEDKLIYPLAFDFSTPNGKPEIYNTLQSKNLRIFRPFYGTNGGKQGAYIGMLAYRKLEKHLQLFVILEGSQGESFEFLGGIGGASWRTNFQANKMTVEASKFGIPKQYWSQGDGKLSYHEGFFQKIFTSKTFFQSELHSMFRELGIKNFSDFQPANGTEVTQKQIDDWRGFTVDLYIVGHSQGGGLVQVGAPYYTILIGEYLYGPSFDNKTFNISHAIALSPARAIGAPYTLKVIMETMGKGNIFGYCSPLDIVPCLPLGHNIDKRPLAKLAAKVGLASLKLISAFLPSEYAELVSTISKTKNNYETLPIFAYEDFCFILEKYCNYSIKAYDKLLQLISDTKAIGNTKKLQQEKERFTKIKQKLPELRKLVKSMQEHYFKAHTANILSSHYHTVKCISTLRKLLKICPVGDMIGSQHFGCYTVLQNENQAWLECLFSSEILQKSIQTMLDYGMKYENDKRKIIGEKSNYPLN